MKSKKFKTPSNTSPKNTKRGCLCPDGKKYSNKKLVWRPGWGGPGR